MQEEFNVHPRSKALQVNHLRFANDIILMYGGNLRSVQILLDSFQRLTKASRVRISAEKLKTVCWNGERSKGAYFNHHGFKEGTPPTRYLGAPLTHHKLSEDDNRILVEKITTRI